MSDQDNGARALAERLHALTVEFGYECDHHADELGVSLECEDSAAAILANGAVFLPDGAELDRLRRIEAAARILIEPEPDIGSYGQWLDSAPVTAWTKRQRKATRALRAALHPEGSARDGG